MPYADSLLARGVISDGAMADMFQRIADLKQPRPYESGSGGGASNVYVPRGYGEKLAPNTGPIRSNPDDVADIHRMVSEGKSMSEIGEWLGISRDAVHGLMTRLGVRSPKPREPAAIPRTVPLLDPDFDIE